MDRVGNLILTALAIGPVTLRNAAKIQFVLAKEVLTLAWVSGQVLISFPVWTTPSDAKRSKVKVDEPRSEEFDSVYHTMGWGILNSLFVPTMVYFPIN